MYKCFNYIRGMYVGLKMSFPDKKIYPTVYLRRKLTKQYDVANFPAPAGPT